MLTKQRLELVNLSHALQKLKISDDRKMAIKQTLKALQIQREVDIYKIAISTLADQDIEKLEPHKIEIIKEIKENIGVGYTEEQVAKIAKKSIFRYLKNN